MKRLSSTIVMLVLSTALITGCGGGGSTTNTKPTYAVTYNGNGNTSGTAPSDSTDYEQGQLITVMGIRAVSQRPDIRSQAGTRRRMEAVRPIARDRRSRSVRQTSLCMRHGHWDRLSQ